jgi:gamma-glutamyltranspeptidase/glutathione hydrolase
VERPVLEGTYRRRRLLTFPPPGAGRALVEILNVLESFSPEEINPDTPEGLQVIAQAFRAALNDRELRTIDPALFSQQRRKRMLDKAYARNVAERIRRLSGMLGTPGPNAPPTAGETTHLSVADSEGNLVALTQSIELVFGAKRMAAGLGFFYNNYMSAFDYTDVMHPYYLLPGGRPWSSIAPTFLFRGGRPSYVLGSPGSERIATTLVQVILRMVDGGASLDAAVDAPRIHAAPGGAAHIEGKRHAPGSKAALTAAGFKVHVREPYAFYLGCVHALRCPRKPGGLFLGVADARRDGASAGPVPENEVTS